MCFLYTILRTIHISNSPFLLFFITLLLWIITDNFDKLLKELRMMLSQCLNVLGKFLVDPSTDTGDGLIAFCFLDIYLSCYSLTFCVGD